MPRVMFTITYGIKPEHRDAYLDLARTMKEHFTAVGKKNYAVYEAKAKKVCNLHDLKTATPTPGPSFMDNYKAAVSEPPLEPMQVMDELYFLGSKWSTAWAIKTSAGKITGRVCRSRTASSHRPKNAAKTKA